MGKKDKLKTAKPVASESQSAFKTHSKLFYAILASVTLLAAVLIVWATPCPNGDLFIGLAGGRDALAGRLGKPDDWSFITAGRPWINQNWGADVVIYLAYLLGNDWGLLILKVVLIAGCAMFTILAARERGVPWHISGIVTATSLLFLASFFTLRANLFTIIFAPLVLWLLYLTQKRSYYIWPAVAVLIIWANAHGGFLFGMGMICLWTACMCLQSIISERSVNFKSNWQYIVASILSFLAAAFINPFGIRNITETLVMAKDSLWVTVYEWRPLWKSDFNSNIRVFIIIIITLAILYGIRIFIYKVQEDKNFNPSQILKRKDAGVVLFENILALVVIIMAFRSMRFIPLAELMVIPIISRQLWRLMRYDITKFAVTIIFGAVVITSISNILRLSDNYSQTSPLYKKSNFFERMHAVNDNFPVELCKFINDNNISGNVLCYWNWEGYMHFNCPQIKVFIGGRAQQVYEEKTYQEYLDFISGKSPLDILRKNNIHALMMPVNQQFDEIRRKVMLEGKWIVIFASETEVYLVDPNSEDTKEITDRFINNKLVYGNSNIYEICKDIYLLNQPMNTEYRLQLKELGRALKKQPLSWAYQDLSDIISNNTNPPQELISFMESELARLEDVEFNKPYGISILKSRGTIAQELYGYYKKHNMDDKLKTAYRSLQTTNFLIKTLTKNVG